MSFSPGPWKVRESRSAQNPRIEVEDATGTWVADARPWTSNNRAVVEQEANARLIAAAPELKAALMECREAIAAAMRVIHGIDLAHRLGLEADNYEQRLVDELHAVGIKDGFGVRASAALAKAEAK